MSATPNIWATVQRLVDKALASYCPHRVGELYISMTDADPSATWPGTEWEAITDAMIRAADKDHPAGSTGGSFSHTMTYDELVRHKHYMAYNRATGSPLIDFEKWSFAFADSASVAAQITENKTLVGMLTTYAGNSKPMDITNKYVAAYIWRRTK